MDKSSCPCYNFLTSYESAVQDMPFSLLPKVMVRELTDLTPEYLKTQKVQLLMLDFDNTIVPYTRNEPTEAVLCWLNRMKQEKIRLCVVSNSKRNRVPAFCEEYGLDCITHAKKPFPKGIRQCLDRYGIPAEFCALAGDQIFTDTLGANCCGVRSILVKPIDNHNIWLKARHALEMPFIFAARRRKIKS